MILTLALLTITQLSPQASSARLLPEESVQGIAGAPRAAILPGLQKVWVVWAVGGALSTVTALGIILGLVATRAGSLTGFAMAILGGMIGGVIHLVCGIIGGVIMYQNGEVRRRAEESGRVPPPSAAAAVTLQPMALALRF